MSEQASSLKIIESKILLLMLVFSFINGFWGVFRIFFPIISRDMGYSALEAGLISTALGHILFFINPILLFIVLFFTCNENLLRKIASSIISLILGSLVGYWLGGLSAAGTLAVSHSEALWAGSLSILSQSLYSASISNVLIGFAAVTSAFIVTRWKASLPESSPLLERPFGIIVLSVIYIVFGVLSTFIFPLILLHPLLAGIFFTKLFLGINLVLLLALGGSSQILIGMGLCIGRKWGWIPAFISAVASILVSIQELTLYEHFDMLGVSILALALFLGVVIAVYLLQPPVRRYFGLVNPPSSP